MEYTWMFSYLFHSFKCWLQLTELILWLRAKNTALVSPSWSSTPSFNWLFSSDPKREDALLSTAVSRCGLSVEAFGIILHWDLPSSVFPSHTPNSTEQIHTTVTDWPELFSCPTIIIIYSEHMKHLFCAPPILLPCKLD